MTRPNDSHLLMHKAIAVIQFKIEGQLIAKHPEWKMDGTRLFEYVNYEKGTVEIDGKEYEMSTCHFPTIRPGESEQAAARKKSPETEAAPFIYGMRETAQAYQNHAAAWLHVCHLQQQPALPCFLSTKRRRNIERGRDLSWRKV